MQNWSEYESVLDPGRNCESLDEYNTRVRKRTNLVKLSDMVKANSVPEKGRGDLSWFMN